MADSTASTSSSSSAPEKVLKYVGYRSEYVGLKGSHREVTKTQFKEAGVANPFTDASQDIVVWAPNNAYQVPKSVFTAEAWALLLKEDDLEEGTAE